MGEQIIPKRNYGIDLLRITAMLMVLILHVLGQGGILNNAPKLSAQYEAAWFMEIVCICAVNCYALISGYVGIGAKYKYTNIILLWLRVAFYTLLITLVFSLIIPQAVDGSAWKRAMFPVMKNQYWYFTAYFCLFFFIPLINKAINAMTEKQSKITVIFFILLFSVLQTVFSDVFGTANGYSALWLLVLYIIGAHIKRFDSLKKCSKIIAVPGYLFMVFVTWLVKYLIEAGILTFTNNSNILFTYTSPTILGAAIFLLAAFEKIKTGKLAGKLISILSPLAFSVFLIHTHPLIWVNFMENRFKAYALMPVGYMILYVLAAAIIIYLICSAIDFVREGLFKLLRLKKCFEKIENKVLGAAWNENDDEKNIKNKQQVVGKGVKL